MTALGLAILLLGYAHSLPDVVIHPLHILLNAPFLPGWFPIHRVMPTNIAILYATQVSWSSEGTILAQDNEVSCIGIPYLSNCLLCNSSAFTALNQHETTHLIKWLLAIAQSSSTSLRKAGSATRQPAEGSAIQSSPTNCTSPPAAPALRGHYVFVSYSGQHAVTRSTPCHLTFSLLQHV